MLHEFQADDSVLSQTGLVKEYKTLLIKEIIGNDVALNYAFSRAMSPITSGLARISLRCFGEF